MSDDIRYTTGEQAARVANAARGCIRIVRGRSTGRIDAADERREQQAADRTRREQDAMYRQLSRAKDDVAEAKTTERTSRGDDKRAAVTARKQAEQRLVDVKRAARRYGL